MAVFTQTGGYRQGLQKIQAGQIAPVYLLFGEEMFLLDQLIEEIARAFLGEIQKEINYFVRYASDVAVEKLLVLLSGGGLFSDKKMIVYKDVQSLQKSQITKMVSFLKNPDPDICLVLVCRTDRLPGTKFNEIVMYAETIQVQPLKSTDLVQFIEKEFSKFGKKLEDNAAEALIYYVGEQIHDLQAQIIQIAQYYENKSVLGAADIEDVAGIYAKQTVFELVRQVADRKIEAAYFVLQNLLEKGESAQSIIYFFIRHFNILFKLRGYLMSRKLTDKQIQKEMKLYPRYYNEYKNQLRFWTTRRLQKALFLLKRADEELKSSLSSPDLILDILIYKLINLN